MCVRFWARKVRHPTSTLAQHHIREPAEEAEPSAVRHDEQDLAGRRTHHLRDVAERGGAVVGHRQSDEIADPGGLREAPVHALDHGHRLVSVVRAGRRNHGLGQYPGRIRSP
jgi:hypothetical protein